VTESELLRLFESHEALVARCVSGEIPLEEFLERYGNFPHAYALDGHEGDEKERVLLNRHAERIRFHFGLLETLSGLCSEHEARSAEYRKAGRFGPATGLARLRQFVQQNSDWRNQ